MACAFACLGQTITIDATESHVTNSFKPVEALGAGVDRLPTGATDKLLSEPVLKQVLEAGWQSVTYRQNTELHVEAWHWNPQGTWSDPAGRGYFTGSTTLGEPIRHSFGYALPHRGFTKNDGVEREGYSRITDGDLTSYWKSNPYLTRAFTGEVDAAHPQWVIVDLGTPQEVNTIRITWGDPWARTYYVQYWTGGDDPIKKATEGSWVTFPAGAIAEGRGGAVTLPLISEPKLVRFVRVWMTASSDTCDDHGPQDRRNCVGYEIREISIGTQIPGGTFHDAVQHSPDQQQTVTYCSSVDPWHTPADLSEKSGDQAGFDLFFTSGVTRGLPAMIQVAMLYGTPEDAAAQIAYLEKRHYPISYIEMGEEPDGQFMLPEDDAALYLQFASALHRIDPALRLGGPVFEGFNEDLEVWPDAQGRVSWLGRFLDYFRAHGRLADLAFFSFEHYPFDPCKTEWSNLFQEPKLISHIMDVFREDGLPASVPMFVTETNLSWNLNDRFVTIFGGLWEADYIASFLTAGGKATYYFHYLPLPLGRGCDGTSGTFSMQTADRQYNVTGPTAQFFASQMISREWVQPGDGVHRVYRASSNITDAAQNVLVTAYALTRPDGQWSLMVLNKDASGAHTAGVVFRDSDRGRERRFTGPVRITTFGAAQYEWHPDGMSGYANPASPPLVSSLTADRETEFTFPKASITVITGKLGR